MNGEGSVGKKRGYRRDSSGSQRWKRGGGPHTNLSCACLRWSLKVSSPITRRNPSDSGFHCCCPNAFDGQRGEKKSHHIGCKAHCSAGLQNRPQCQYDSII